MGFIGKAHDWYQRHKVIRAFATAAEGASLLSGGTADAEAAKIFCNGPVAASAAKTEKPKLDITGDFSAYYRFVDGTAGKDFGEFDSWARVNLGYQAADGVNLGARGVAGYSTFPTFYPHVFDDEGSEFFIDRAFANIRFGEHLCLDVGGIPNKLTGWHDKDIPLVGGQITYSDDGGSLLDSFMTRIVYHCGQPWLHESDSKLAAIELEGGKKLAGDWSFVGNLNYMHWMRPDADFIETNLRDGSGFASDFRIINAGARLVNSGADVPVFGPPLVMYGKGMYNTGASDENIGGIFGLSVGRLKDPGDTLLAFEYRYIPADAALASYGSKVTPKTNFELPGVAVRHKCKNNMIVGFDFAVPGGISDRRGHWKYGAFYVTYQF
jgi:hypothetical protein